MKSKWKSWVGKVVKIFKIFQLMTENKSFCTREVEYETGRSRRRKMDDKVKRF